MKKTINEIKNRLGKNATHVSFEYNGKICGIDPVNGEYNMWCGYGHEYTAISITEAVNIPFFDGKKLQDIVDDIDIIDF